MEVSQQKHFNCIVTFLKIATSLQFRILPLCTYLFVKKLIQNHTLNVIIQYLSVKQRLTTAQKNNSLENLISRNFRKCDSKLLKRNPTCSEARKNHPKPNHIIHFEINVHVSLHFCDERTIRTKISLGGCCWMLMHWSRVFITSKVTMALKPCDRLKSRTLGYYRPNLVTNRPIIYKDFCLVSVEYFFRGLV